MNRVVVDASLALAWGFPDEASDYADAVLAALDKKTISVPALWPAEVANGLIVGERKKRLGVTEIKLFAALIGNLSVEYDSQSYSHYSDTVLPFARDYGLTAYDASYLELSLRLAAPIATLDAKLRKACKQAGVKFFQ